MRRSLFVTAGCTTVLGMLGGPAAAGATTTRAPAPAVVFHDPASSLPLQARPAAAIADAVAELQAALDRVEQLTTADRAQWSEVPPSAVLTGSQRQEAWNDLHQAKRALAFLRAVEASGVATAAQQEQIDELQADLQALATRLRTLLANEPAVPTTEPAAVTATATTAARHVCDHDGSFGSGGDGTWDWARSWGGRPHHDWHR